MKLTPLIQKAIDTSARLHRKKSRKNDKALPYVSHCFSVACIVSEYTSKPEIIAAALLHDTLEDVKEYRFDDLAREFGLEVANLVKAVSEDKDPGVEIDKRITWMDRKKGYLKNLEKHGPEAQLICAADKIHNLRSATEWYKETGERVWEKFNASLKNQIWYHQSVLRIVKVGLRGNMIVGVLEREVQEFIRISAR